LLQSAKFAAQFNPHIPFIHVAVELGPLGHTLPHVPQLLTLPTLTSQPLPAFRSQSAKPIAHDSMAHMPITHASLELAKLQAFLQNPQFCVVSMDVSHPSEGSLLQSAVPAPQGLFLHVPFEHVWKALHLLPHIPQLFGSVSKIASHPLPACASQFANPALH
jgi:hypothetical protein